MVTVVASQRICSLLCNKIQQIFSAILPQKLLFSLNCIVTAVHRLLEEEYVKCTINIIPTHLHTHKSIAYIHGLLHIRIDAFNDMYRQCVYVIASALSLYACAVHVDL